MTSSGWPRVVTSNLFGRTQAVNGRQGGRHWRLKLPKPTTAGQASILGCDSHVHGGADGDVGPAEASLLWCHFGLDFGCGEGSREGLLIHWSKRSGEEGEGSGVRGRGEDWMAFW